MEGRSTTLRSPSCEDTASNDRELAHFKMARSSCTASCSAFTALLLISSARALAPPQPAPYHVHVGAGKLGLSLVVPAVAARGRDFAVLDTPKDPAWAEMLAKGRQDIDVRVNDAHVTTLNFHDGLSAPDGAPRLIVTDDVQALGATVARATTVSCSLGPHLNAVMTHLFECADNYASEPKTLYCCENDHSAVVQLRDDLGDRVKVVDCMVDRVSTQRVVDAETGTISMSCEDWGGVIASLDPRVNEVQDPPFGGTYGAEVHAPLTMAAAAFLSDRKLQLVNGMHTTLAFATMRLHGADEPGSLALGRPSELDGVELRRWSLARCAGLIAAHGVPAVMDAFDASSEAEAFAALEAYARQALQRFDDAPDDTVARVLGGGVALRWRGRLAATEGELATALSGDAAAARFLTTYADAADVTRAVSGLVRATRPACELDDARRSVVQEAVAA